MLYHAPVRIGRFLWVILYATYLIHVGLLLTLAPWSPLWGQVVTWVPQPWSTWLALPAVRGALTGTGILHLLLAAAEVLLSRPRSLPKNPA